MEKKREPYRVLTLKKKYFEKQIFACCFLAQSSWTKIPIIMI